MQEFKTSNQPCPLQTSEEDNRKSPQNKCLYFLTYNIKLLIPAWILILGAIQGIKYSNNSSLKILLPVDEHVWTYWINFVFKCQDLEIIYKFTTNSVLFSFFNKIIQLKEE